MIDQKIYKIISEQKTSCRAELIQNSNLLEDASVEEIDEALTRMRSAYRSPESLPSLRCVGGMYSPEVSIFDTGRDIGKNKAEKIQSSDWIQANYYLKTNSGIDIEALCFAGQDACYYLLYKGWDAFNSDKWTLEDAKSLYSMPSSEYDYETHRKRKTTK